MGYALKGFVLQSKHDASRMARSTLNNRKVGRRGAVLRCFQASRSSFGGQYRDIRRCGRDLDCCYIQVSARAGQEIEGPMAITVLGGLLSSTLLNLRVLPALAGRFVRRHR